MIELKNVKKKFGDFTVLDDVNLSVETGMAYGLLGSNGAGKSTILRLISGIYKQESGEVLVDGEEAFDNVLAKERIFFINDETVQFNHFTLKELKNYYKHFYVSFSDEIFEKLNAIIKLPLDKKMGQFSKGMRRQAVVIIGLASQADYLLLDEAFDGLDPTMRIIVKRMLVDAMIDRKLTTIISSHNLKEINEICDTVALLHQGKIIFQKDLDSLKGDIHKVQVAFEQEIEMENLSSLNILHSEKLGSIYHFIIKGDVKEIEHSLNQFAPKVLDMVPLTLEEIFIYEMEGLGYEYDGIKE